MRATWGIVTSAPERVSSRQASMMALRVRAFWFVRPAVPVTGIGQPPPSRNTEFVMVLSPHERILASIMRVSYLHKS